MSLISALTQIQSGDADTPTRDMSNWNAIRDVVNGQLGNVNFGSSDPLAISKTALGTYTPWTTWAPTITATTGTLTTAVANLARYSQIGKTVFLEICIGCSGIAGSIIEVRFTPPIAPVATTLNYLNGAGHYSDTTGVPFVCKMTFFTTYFKFEQSSAAAFSSAGAGALWSGTISYEVA